MGLKIPLMQQEKMEAVMDKFVLGWLLGVPVLVLVLLQVALLY
jgi:hypothetical protein